jgi:hypothetical protein
MQGVCVNRQVVRCDVCGREDVKCINVEGATDSMQVEPGEVALTCYSTVRKRTSARHGISGFASACVHMLCSPLVHHLRGSSAHV